jgi:hypothetical protein
MYVCNFSGHPGEFNKNGMLKFTNKQGQVKRRRLRGCKRKVPGKPRKTCPYLVKLHCFDKQPQLLPNRDSNRVHGRKTYRQKEL